MNTAVNQLLDVDREARQLLDEAQQYYDHTMVEIGEEKKAMLEAYKKKSGSHIKNLEEELAGELRDLTAAVEVRTQTLLAAMEARYDENHLQWEEELVRRTVGGKV